MAAVLKDTTKLDGTDGLDEAQSTSALRRRIQTQMAELSASWERSWWFRFRRRLVRTPIAAYVGSAALLLAVLWQGARAGENAAPLGGLAPARDGLPIATLTPGASRPVDVVELCAGGPPARMVITPAVRLAVLHHYRMETVADDEYELDYLITPELGGIPDERNLWPERYTSGVWNARVKDDLERLLPQLVCEGRLDLRTAQRAIAENWIAAYQRYFSTAQPLPPHATQVDDDENEPSPGRPPAAARAPSTPTQFAALSVSTTLMAGSQGFWR